MPPAHPKRPFELLLADSRQLIAFVRLPSIRHEFVNLEWYLEIVSQERRVVRHASRMAVVTLFCRITGYLRDKALFSVIGAGHLYDMYRTANRIPNAFRGLFAEGTLHAAFVPTLARLTGKEGDRREAVELFRGLLAVMLLVVGLVVAVGILASPWLVRLYAEGFATTPGKLETTVLMNRIMFPYLLLISLAALLQAVLNSHEKFLLAASTPMFYNLTIAGTAWFVIPRFANPAPVLSAAVLVGGVLQFLVQAPAVRRLGFSLRPLWSGFSDPEVKAVLERLASVERAAEAVGSKGAVKMIRDKRTSLGQDRNWEIWLSPKDCGVMRENEARLARE